MKDNDIVFEMVSDEYEIALSAKCLLSISKEEWFLDPSIGLDRSFIYDKNFNFELLHSLVVDALSKDERLIVDDVRYSLEGRVLTVNVDISTEDGQSESIEVTM